MERTHWALKGYIRVCALTECVCICLTGENLSSNYCCLEYSVRGLPFALTVSYPHLPLFHLDSFLPQHSLSFLALPSFQFLSIHTLPHLHPSSHSFFSRFAPSPCYQTLLSLHLTSTILSRTLFYVLCHLYLNPSVF